MSDSNPHSMTNDELKQEHRQLQAQLQQLRDERSTYEPTETSGSRQVQEGSRAETARIDQQMDAVRNRQRQLYNEYQRRNGNA